MSRRKSVSGTGSDLVFLKIFFYLSAPTFIERFWNKTTHPPEVLPVRIFGDIFCSVTFSHKGAKACAFGDVFSAYYTNNLVKQSWKTDD